MFGLVRRNAAPLAIYSIATVVLTWPIARDASTHLFTPQSRLGTLLMDILHINWVLAWGAHALFHAPLSLFDGNMLYPTPGTLALSEHLLGGMPVYGSVLALSGNSVLAFNCWILSSFLLAGLFTHCLVRRWSGQEAAAYVAGLAFAFAPWRFPGAIGLPHLLQIQYFPLVLLAVDNAVVRKRVRDGVALGVALGVQTLSSYYLGYQAFLIVALFILTHLATAGPHALLEATRALATAAVVSMALILPLTLPYLMTDARVGIRTMDWSEQFMALWGTIDQWQAITDAVGTATLALGLVGVSLALFRTFSRGARDRDLQRRLLACVIIAVTGLVLMRGPLGLFGSTLSPYSMLAALVPGFENMRAPGRFVYLPVLASAVLAGYAIAWLSTAVGHRVARALLATAAAGAVVYPVATASLPAERAYAAPAVAPVYHWLAEHGEGGPLLELDRSPGLRNYLDAKAMFESRHHWLPLVTGYTSHVPPYYEFVVGLAKAMPESASLDKLVECTGVRWIIAGDLGQRRLDAWLALDGVRQAGIFPNGDSREYLFEVQRESAGPCREHLLNARATTEGREAKAPAALHGSVRIEAPEPWAPSTEFPVELVVRNDGSSVWPSTAVDSAERVIVQLRWKNPAGNPAPTWAEIMIPRDLAPGEEIRIQRWVRSPRRPGTHSLAARVWVHRREAERAVNWRALLGRLDANAETKRKRSRNRIFDLTSTPSVEIPITVAKPSAITP